VPDKVAPWIATAAPAGTQIVRREGIDVIMSTSPPGSVHLVAEAVAAATRKPFVADFRDSWLDSPHRNYDRVSVRAKRRLVAGMARSVVSRAAALTAATGSIAQELAGIHASAAHKTTVIENGADFDDFEGLARTTGDRFTIVHAGSFFGQRSPRPFLLGLQRMLARRPELREQVQARFVGTLRPSDREWAQQLGLDGVWEELGFLPYRESIREQRAADALLLLIPDADGRGDTILSGKVFEYIASRRPILASVPPAGAAANLLRSLAAGEVVGPEDTEAIASALERLVDRWKNGAGLPDAEYGTDVLERLSRRSRAHDLAEVLRRVAG
jgi:glycosyltransferase involved in cell wall biosynthesis